MSKETPKDDPRQETDDKSFKGKDQPWKEPGQASQDSNAKDAGIDLEKWQKTSTH